MALSANASLTIRNDRGKIKFSPVIKTSSVFYSHALGAVTAAGKALPCADSATQRFAGIALGNSTGVFPVTGDGTRTVDLYRGLEIKVPQKTGALTAADVMTVAVYAFDDAQVTDATTLGPEVGYMTQLVSTTSVWVFLGINRLAKAS